MMTLTQQALAQLDRIGMLPDDTRVLRASASAVIVAGSGVCAKWRPGASSSPGWDFARYLAAEGAPVALPLQLHSDEHGVAEQWQLLEGGGSASRIDLARSLAELHSIAVGYDGPLPSEDSLDRIAVRVERVRGLIAGSAQPAVSAQLPGRAAAIAARLVRDADGGPVQALHGDPHDENAIVAPDGSIRWIDLDTARIGPVAYDVAKLAWQSDLSERERIADAYGVERAQVERQLRRVLVPTWLWQAEMALLHPDDPHWLLQAAKVEQSLGEAERTW